MECALCGQKLEIDTACFPCFNYEKRTGAYLCERCGRSRAGRGLTRMLIEGKILPLNKNEWFFTEAV